MLRRIAVILGVASLAAIASPADAEHLFLYGNGVVSAYTTAGAFVANFVAPGSGGLGNAAATNGNLRFGPDGNLYVGSNTSVKKYDGLTGAYLGDFASGLNGAADVVFDSSGNVYVSEYFGNRISKFSSTGALLGTYASGVSSPSGMTFRSNGNLLVANSYATPNRNTITELNPATGAFVGTFATGLGEPIGLVAGPDGRYYAGNFRYATSFGGTNPDTIQVVASSGGASTTWNSGGSLSGTMYIAFADGDLFVTSLYNNRVFRFNGASGAFVSSFSGPDGVSGIAVRGSRAVPEPSTCAALLGLVAAGLALGLWRRRSW